MECLISSSSAAHLVNKTNNCDAGLSQLPIRPRNCNCNCNRNRNRKRFSVSSKKSSFKDFQDYAKPRRLKGLESIDIGFGDELLVSSDESQSLYKLHLRTSSIYGSALTDLNAGVLICIIDQHGDALLSRIPSILCPQPQPHTQDHIHFSTGSLDQFFFIGPKLGPIQALWIGLDSGNWRLGGASLTTLSVCPKHAQECSGNGDVHQSFTYSFEVEDVMLGEGSDTAMVELRPWQVTEYSGADLFGTPDINAEQVPTLAERRRMNEESMREYANLKFSLLFYDSMLIFGGTSISTITGGKEAALAFFTGGVGGFLYLMLLQRSVDKLAAPESVVITDTSNLNSQLGGVKAPLLVLAFALGLGVVTVNNGASGLAPTDILVGVLGFLACKVAVVLSAFKPLSMSVQKD